MVMKVSRREFLRASGALGLAGLTGIVSIVEGTGCGGGGEGKPPVKPPPDPSKNLVNLIGDIHVHTSYSDGDESPDFALHYARDVSKLDFCCLTDHSEVIASDSFKGLDYYKSLPGMYDHPGKFCVLYGYEWTNPEYVHRCVYSTDNSIPFLPASDAANYHIEDFWKKLDGYNVITVPHHVMAHSSRIWWKYVNPEMEPLVEFYSKWGLSLMVGNPRPVINTKNDNAIFKAFNAGLHYGLLANTDTHSSRPASHLMEQRPNALLYSQPGTTGVWAGSHTRESIFDALKRRRCYGMTGTKVGLMFAVNGSIMGTDIEASEPPTIYYKATTDVKITQVTIVKFSGGNSINLKVLNPDTLETTGTYVDNTFGGDSGYAVIVDLENGDMAMASPVWVKKTKSGSMV
jgi:hypothetical protein